MAQTGKLSEQTFSLRELTSRCCDLANRAGELIRDVSDRAASGGSTSDLGLVDKGADAGTFDPQTVADRRAQRCIVEGLRAVYGNELRIVGEEGELGSDQAADAALADQHLLDENWPEESDVQLSASELCVWIDPLDGTKEFVEGKYEYVSTLVGITCAGRPVAGVISEPYFSQAEDLRGRVLWGCCLLPRSAGGGVHVLGDVQWTRPARPPGRCVAIVSRSRSTGAVADALLRLSEPGSDGATGPLVTDVLRAGGAGHKVTRVVDGTCDLWLFPRPGTSRWDTCAAEAMLEASGGLLRDGSGCRVSYDPDGEMGNVAGVLAGADSTVVEKAALVCATLDALRDADGAPLSRSWFEEVLGISRGAVEGFAADTNSCVRGKHSTVTRVELRYSQAALPTLPAGLPSSVMLKRVVPSDLDPRSTKTWLRDIASYRAEINFARLWAGFLGERGVRLPQVYHVVSEGVEGIDEEMVAGGESEEGRQRVLACRFLTVMEDFRPDAFRQEFELGRPDLEAALQLAARMHGNTAEESTVRRAEEELLAEGCYWALSKRDQAELEALPKVWLDLAFELAREEEALFLQMRVRELGRRLQSVSRVVDEALRKSRELRCLVHGDFKTANIFFEKATGEAVPIDFQWAGVNLGVQDVAYLLLSSASLEELEEGGNIESLLAAYQAEREAVVVASSGSAEATRSASSEDLLRKTFKLACLDYARVVFGYQLRGRDAAWIRTGAQNLGRCTHNRSIPHFLGFVRFIAALLDEWEATGDLSGKSGTMPGYSSVWVSAA